MKHLRYLWYVIRHKWFVLRAGLITRAPLWRLLIHDWSKFTPAEWFPYVEYFYGKVILGLQDPVQVQRESAFDLAWLHHQHINKHHWQHWVLRMDSGDTKCVPIPDRFVREMVADWMGAGRVITGKWEADEWFFRAQGNMMLHPDTFERVEFLVKDASRRIRGEK